MVSGPGQNARAKRSRKLGNFACNRECRSLVMSDQGDRLGGIATLDRENPFECVSGKCIGADSVKGLCRIDDRITSAQGFNCPRERIVIDVCLRS